MTIHHTVTRTLAVSSFLVAFSLAGAHAQEATAVAERLKAAMAAQGMELSWSGVSGDASELTLSGATFGAAGADEKAALGDVTLSDVSEENGTYRIGSATLPDYSVTEEGMKVDVSGIEVTGITLPAKGSEDPFAGLMLYETASMESLTVSAGDKTPFSLTELHFEITPPTDGNAMEFSGAAEKFSADLSLVEDPEAKKVVDALGLQTLSGYFEVNGSWHPTDGRLELAQYDISVDKAGTLGFTFDISGYTLDFVKAMQEMQKQMAASPEGAESSAQGLAMLGLLQQLTFNAASIRFDDDSLTHKVLDYIGGQQQADRTTVANQAKAVVPFLMAQLNNPELTSQVTAALNAYLDDPKSIEISAEPENAVPFAVIMAGAMSPSPQDLVKTLGVSVTANDQ